jgi:hypothetical protein
MPSLQGVLLISWRGFRGQQLGFEFRNLCFKHRLFYERGIEQPWRKLRFVVRI